MSIIKENVNFIEFPEEFCYEYRTIETAPIFRKRFNIKQEPKNAILTVCGLGYGYYYLNGKAVVDDLFTAPTSEYNKTVWYNVYDITEQLNEGENLFAVILGNGFYNETLHTVWENNNAEWRDVPKFFLELEIDYGDYKEKIVSDESWICSKNSPILFNQLRSGETYDARVGEAWRFDNYDDSDWINARASKKLPKGVLRECPCEPIIRDTEYQYIDAFINASGNWVLDFGQNMSGFVRVEYCGESGTQLLLRHSERLKDDGTCEFNTMDSENFYTGCDFQVDRVILGEGKTCYEPRFTYHGFRYLEIEGLDRKPEKNEFTAIFVHQDIKTISTFDSSNETLNTIFNISRISCWSNLFYIPTDCPTREKMGWANDAQASCEQLLQNYDIYNMFSKWLQDIFDSMRPDGSMPGIIPSHGWGYEWGTGPISTGVLYEYPYKMYRYTGNDEPIKAAYPYMLKHLEYNISKIDSNDGLIGYGLCDWAGPFPAIAPTPLKLTDTLLVIKFLRVTIFSAELLGDSDTAKKLKKQEKELEESFCREYINEDGSSKISEQTALAMMIDLGVYDKLEPLKMQLISEIEKYNYHHHCGMLGLQYLFNALDICDISDLGIKMITADGHPSFKQWITDGATTMYERWSNDESNNHHMFTSLLSWFNRSLVGLRLDDNINAFKKAIIAPVFAESLNYCSGTYNTKSGYYSVSWKRLENENIALDIEIPEGATAKIKLKNYAINGETLLNSGKYSIICNKM